MRLPYALRAAGSALLGGVPCPVLAGPNAGRLWTLASSGRGYVSGRFERERVQAILSLLRPGDRVWDVGAHKGYLALAMARRVGRGGAVVAFEPSRRNLVPLRRHVRWNRAANVEVVASALGDGPGHARFGGSGSSITYRLGRGDELVEVTTIAAQLAAGRTPPTVLKLDVEGSEGAVLAGAGSHLSAFGLLFVAVHDLAAHRHCRELLDGAGFEVVEGRKMRRFTRDGESWAGDADLVAWRPGRGVSRADVEGLPAYR